MRSPLHPHSELLPSAMDCSQIPYDLKPIEAVKDYIQAELGRFNDTQDSKVLTFLFDKRSAVIANFDCLLLTIFTSRFSRALEPKSVETPEHERPEFVWEYGGQQAQGNHSTTNHPTFRH